MSALTFETLSTEVTLALATQSETPPETAARCTLGRDKVMVLIEYPLDSAQAEPMATQTLDWLEQYLRHQFDTTGLPEEAADLAESGEEVAVQLFLKHFSEAKPFTMRSFIWKVDDGFDDLFGQPGAVMPSATSDIPIFQHASGKAAVATTATAERALVEAEPELNELAVDAPLVHELAVDESGVDELAVDERSLFEIESEDDLVLSELDEDHLHLDLEPGLAADLNLNFGSTLEPMLSPSSEADLYADLGPDLGVDLGVDLGADPGLLAEDVLDIDSTVNSTADPTALSLPGEAPDPLSSDFELPTIDLPIASAVNANSAVDFFDLTETEATETSLSAQSEADLEADLVSGTSARFLDYGASATDDDDIFGETSDRFASHTEPVDPEANSSEELASEELASEETDLSDELLLEPMAEGEDSLPFELSADYVLDHESINADSFIEVADDELSELPKDEWVNDDELIANPIAEPTAESELVTVDLPYGDHLEGELAETELSETELLDDGLSDSSLTENLLLEGPETDSETEGKANSEIAYDLPVFDHSAEAQSAVDVVDNVVDSVIADDELTPTVYDYESKDHDWETDRKDEDDSAYFLKDDSSEAGRELDEPDEEDSAYDLQRDRSPENEPDEADSAYYLEGEGLEDEEEPDETYEDVALIDEGEVQRQRDQWQQQSRGNPWIFAGALGFVVVGLVGFGVTRPCTFGQCDRLQTAQAQGDKALDQLSFDTSLKAVTASKAQLKRSVSLLEPIPFWSSYYGQAQAILPAYKSQVSELDRVSEAQAVAYQAALDSQNPPHSVAKWQSIASQWRAAAEALEKVPADSPIHDLANQKLVEYRSNLSTVKVRIDAEARAEVSLRQAQQASGLGKARSETAGSLEDWEDALASWELAVSNLEQIMQGTNAYGEAQKLLPEYEEELERVRLSTQQERSATKELNQAKQLAAEAQRVGTEDQWTLSVQNWTAAVNQLKDIAEGTLAYSEAQAMLGLYSSSLIKAQNNQQVALRFQPVEPSFFAACGATDAQKCTYSVRGGNVRLDLFRGYDSVIDQSITPPDQRQAIAPQTAQIVSQANQLLQQVTLLSTQAQVPVELYNAEGNFVARYQPDLNGFVRQQEGASQQVVQIDS